MGGYKFNVKNCQYAPVSVDNSTTYTIGTVVPLPDLRTIDITFLTATGELYGDGKLAAKDAKLTGAQAKIGINKIPQAARADMLGHTVDSNGIMHVKTTDVQKQIAVYAELELNNGGYEAVWLLSGKCEPINITGNQAEGNINYTTDELTINFIARKKDSEVIQQADTDNASFTTAAQTAFKAGPDPTVAAPSSP